MTPRIFTSILIANRGEIACRIIRTAKSMGLKTIAVYSDADAHAPHVKMADHAIHIGPAQASESYLMMDKILEAAKATQAGAIHPGYGFLSENAEFAKACQAAEIVFVGPKPDAIELMGDKAKAKRRMIKAAVPCLPGYHGKTQDDATLIAESKNIGFPIMVKAAAGGGGRGMRCVTNSKALTDALSDARSEAQNAFGSDILILERAVQRPHHVEIQIIADRFGHTIHLGERDCSVQRRHQKVIEEAPCPVMTETLRQAMGESAVKAAKNIGYIGVGTVEYMLDSNGAFYFLEMNTRLQVEHAVTERITGLDLVALQISIAQGAPLEFTQDDIVFAGHAIEARLYAEDVSADFLPATGKIDMFLPTNAPSIRLDSGIETGSDISPFYDPMLAKIIAHGPSRETARLKLIHALKDTALFGVKTNQAFLIQALEREDFIKGVATTAFIAENFSKSDLEKVDLNPLDAAISALTQFLHARESTVKHLPTLPPALLNWSSATKLITPYQYGAHCVDVTPITPSQFSVAIEDKAYSISVVKWNEASASYKINSVQYPLHYHVQFFVRTPSRIDILIEGQTHALINKFAEIEPMEEKTGKGSVMSPLHGALLNIFVKVGDKVTKGMRLAIIEAMKMQHEILAEIDGNVRHIHVVAKTQIAAHTLMMEIQGEETK